MDSREKSLYEAMPLKQLKAQILKIKKKAEQLGKTLPNLSGVEKEMRFKEYNTALENIEVINEIIENKKIIQSKNNQELFNKLFPTISKLTHKNQTVESRVNQINVINTDEDIPIITTDEDLVAKDKSKNEELLDDDITEVLKISNESIKNTEPLKSLEESTEVLKQKSLKENLNKPILINADLGDDDDDDYDIFDDEPTIVLKNPGPACLY